jgi:hypothetical protein
MEARGTRVLAALGAALLAACLAGCRTSTTPPPSTLMETAPDSVVASATELRIRIRVYSSRFAHLVEDAADEIIATSEDRSVRHAALEWKTKAIPQAQSTCFHSDPLAALFDTWALAIQQRMYFEDPVLSARFGPARGVALAASNTIVEEVEEIARSVKEDGNIDRSRDYVTGWAEANPVEGEWLRRRSILGKLAEAIASDDLGLVATVGRMAEDLSDLSMRASLYNELLPRQSRWQAELLAYELGLFELEELLLETLPRLTALTERAVVLAESAPDTIAAERQVVLEQLALEADDVLAEVRREREAVLARLTLEREAAQDFVAAQWPVVREDLPAVAGRSAEATTDPLTRVVDHAVRRLALLGRAGLAGLLLVGLVLVLVAKR